MEVNKILLYFIKIFHQFIVYFIVLGVFLPSKYLIYYIPFWPLVYLHWKFNSNRCFLTELEYWIESKPFPSTVNNDHNYPFIRSMTGKLFDKLTNDQLHQLVITLFTLTWFIGLIRYYFYITKN